ncbi:MAG: class I SAM-dependent methyltransferase [Anaerolineales bacterium]
MSVVDIYTRVAPLYDGVRSAWAKGIMGRAEAYMEREALPRLVTPETRILDLGSGTGVNLNRLRRLGLPFGSYTGLDMTPAMLMRAQAKLDGQTAAAFLQGDIWRMPFADREFDLVISTWALSHLWPARDVFDEVSRVLDTKGTMFALFWSRPAWPMSQVAKWVERSFEMRFVERADLERSLGGQAITHRFAAGWGASLEFNPSPM